MLTNQKVSLAPAGGSDHWTAVYLNYTTALSCSIIVISKKEKLTNIKNHGIFEKECNERGSNII